MHALILFPFRATVQAALLLTRHGAKVDVTDREGNTVLSLCATKEQRQALLAAASVDGFMDVDGN